MILISAGYWDKNGFIVCIALYGNACKVRGSPVADGGFAAWLGLPYRRGILFATQCHTDIFARTGAPECPDGDVVVVFGTIIVDKLFALYEHRPVCCQKRKDPEQIVSCDSRHGRLIRNPAFGDAFEIFHGNSPQGSGYCIIICHGWLTADSFKFSLDQASLLFKIPVNTVYAVNRHFLFLCFALFPRHIMEEGGMAAQAAVPPHLFHQRRVLPPTKRRVLPPTQRQALVRAGKSRNAESPSGPPDASVGQP